MKWREVVLVCSFIVPVIFANAQNSVGIGIANPNKHAVLELISPGSNQGFLIPKLTTAQRTAGSFTGGLSAKENGLMVFDSDQRKFYYWDSTAWKEMGTGGGSFLGGDGITIVNNTISTIPQDIEISGSTLTVTGNPAAVPIDLSDLNIPQDLQLTGSTLKITNNPSATQIDLSSVNVPQDIQISGSTLTVTNNPSATPINLSALNIPQDLQLIGSTLTITNNPSATPVNLGAFTGTNTDEQTLAYDGATGTLEISRLVGGPQTVTIPLPPASTPPSGSAGGDLSGNYPNPTVANNAITSGKILDGTIASADILDGTVASADITDLTITNADISAAAAIVVSKIAPSGTPGQVLTTVGTNTQWANAPAASGAAGGDLTGNYPNPDIAANVVTTAEILDGTVASADITDGTVASIDITDGTVASVDIADGQVFSIDIADNTIFSADINDGTIASVDILDNSISTADIWDATIQGTDIAANTITNNNIAAAAGILVSKIAPSGTPGQILTTVGVTTQWANAPAPSGAAGGDLTGTYPNPDIAANAVTTAEINDLTIANADISTTAAIAVTKLAPSGTNGFVLTTSGGAAQWAAPGASALISAPGTQNLFAGATMGGSTGQENAYFGNNAGSTAASNGSWNVAVGAGAGRNMTQGSLNTLMGWIAGGANASGTFNGNTFIGAQAGQNSTGGPNTFIGEKAGQTNTTGTENVLIGNSAGLVLTTGGRNTILGYQANVAGANTQNSIAIGYQAVVDANNKVRIGNGSITVIEGNVGFTAASDRRLKSNIRPIDVGLDLVMKLKPVQYNMKYTSDTRLNWGFIAQDIQSIVGETNAVLTVSENEQKTLGLRYSDFVAPLVKAVQEQQDQITDLNEKLDESEKKVETLMAEIEQIKKAIGLKASSK